MTTTRSIKIAPKTRPPSGTSSYQQFLFNLSTIKPRREDQTIMANPRTTSSNAKNDQSEFVFEFFGPVGTAGCTLILPVVVLLLMHWSYVGKVDFSFLPSLFERRFWDKVLDSQVLCPSCRSYAILIKCSLGVMGWFLFQVVLERFLPCDLVQGTPIKGDIKNRLWYRINGHLSFWVTLLFALTGWPVWHEASSSWQFTSAPIDILFDHYAELALVTIVLCFVMSSYLYISSFNGKKVLADGGNSGILVYDFFIGRELNPRVGNFDLKEFCELRPGLIGWMLLNISCMVKQHQFLGYVSGSMILINIFQGIYVWDALYQERAILTTMDITQDGFGFMLCFGDLTWVPFTYSVQAKYLVNHDPQLPYSTLLLIICVHIFGYVVFRGANGQKDAFRRNPDDPKLSHLQYLQTKRGTKLLTSGWWGMARKINYTGDWLMGLSWCMVCGIDSIVPYYYAIYFAILLIHRSERDDHLCKVKYGDDWDTYKQLVPYRFIPGVI